MVGVEGSSYRRPGARMLVTDDGKWEGAISGGCLEGDALVKARQAMENDIPMVVTYDTMDDDANSLEVGLGCNGIIDVFFEPVHPNDPANPIVFLKDHVRDGEYHVLATVLKSGNGSDLRPGKRFILTENDSNSIPGRLLEDMRRTLSGEVQGIKIYDDPGELIEVFIERISPDPELVIFGAGYDVIPVVRLAGELGWPVTVTEDCVAHLAPRRFTPSTCLIFAERDAVLEKIKITDHTAAVLMSHNYKYDLAVLDGLLSSDIPYIGVLGPLKRFEKIRAELENRGKLFPESAWSRVHAPIGLDIGAEAPDEIALSILSEIKAFFTGKSAGFLKDRKIPIHDRASREG